MKKILLGLGLVLMSNAFAGQVYHCDTRLVNSQLIFNDDESIVLKSGQSQSLCKMGSVYFPGTEVELKTLNCEGKKKFRYYFTEYDSQTIILSGESIFSKDITCRL